MVLYKNESMIEQTNMRIIPKGCRNNGVRQTSDNVSQVRCQGLNDFDEDTSKLYRKYNVIFEKNS